MDIVLGISLRRNLLPEVDDESGFEYSKCFFFLDSLEVLRALIAREPEYRGEEFIMSRKRLILLCWLKITFSFA